MGEYICHHDGHFFLWSSIVDAPVTFGMTRHEFEEHWRDEYGRRGLEDLGPRIERALAKGTSSMLHPSLLALTRFNRAGFKGNTLTFDEIIRIYLVEGRDPVEGEGVKPPFDDDDDEDE